MQQIKEIVKQYLQMDTNYALMITGDWGIGKTHYFKHTLKKEISETPVFSDNDKNYKPILVSLFGIKSVEEIQSEIFLCLYPFLKNTKIKLSATIGKAIVKGILHLKGFGEYSKYVEEIDVNKKSLINFEELVICFDDLERKSENLKIEELIGYINSLVENENVKILLIANEEKIEDSSYKKLKEKTVSKGMRKEWKKQNYKGPLENYLNIELGIEYYEHKKRIKGAILDLNNKILAENKRREASELEKLCYDNFMEFFKKILNRHEAIYYEPYFSKFNANTIEKIVTRWAPPNENNTAGYIANVEKWSGVSRKKTLRLADGGDYIMIVAAMSFIERVRQRFKI